MNKSIKGLIEEYIVSFNPAVIDDKSPKKKLSQDIINKALYTYNPETKDDLIEVIKQCIKENKFGDEQMYYPDLSGINVSNITNLSELFNQALSQISTPIKLDLRDWDTSSVTDMGCMFSDCESLKELDLSGWDTSKVTDMWGMFDGCKQLKELNISGWDTSKVTDMWSMFNDCESLEELDLSDWNTSRVTNMSFMFNGCKSLEKLNLSGWNTSRVTNMQYMFNKCRELIIPDWYEN